MRVMRFPFYKFTFKYSREEFLDGSVGKEYACNARDTGDEGSIPGLGRSPGGGNSNQLQYSCLRNPMDRGAWQAADQRVTKSQASVAHRVSECLLTWPIN